jgi:hypothetical protein
LKSLQFIRKRDDFIAVRHRQRTARQKIILKIHDDQAFILGVRSALCPCLSLAKGVAKDGSGRMVHFNRSCTRAINVDLKWCSDRSSPML